MSLNPRAWSSTISTRPCRFCTRRSCFNRTVSKPSTSILTRHRPRAAADSLMTREVDALFPGTTFLRDTPRRRAALFESRVPVRLARNCVDERHSVGDAIQRQRLTEQTAGALIRLDAHEADVGVPKRDRQRHRADVAADVDHRLAVARDREQAILKRTVPGFQTRGAGPRPRMLDRIQTDHAAVKRLLDNAVPEQPLAERSERMRAMDPRHQPVSEPASVAA